jgi:hypothetical protein
MLAQILVVLLDCVVVCVQQLDDPSDDSGVDLNNPPPLDPRAFLSLDGYEIDRLIN